MSDFVGATPLEEIGPGRYRTRLDSHWMTWGPAGGYVAATALRAGAATSELCRPASFSCQFLKVARFDTVELEVESLRRGRSAECRRIRMSQEGEPVLEAHLWAVAENEGLEHDYTRAPAVPSWRELPDVRDLQPDRPQRGIFGCLERRPIGWREPDDMEPREPVMQSWYRYRPTPVQEGRFDDACRALILIDVFSWPATWAAHPSSDPSPWIAPNLDLHVRFHHDPRPHEWLLCETRAELAAEGLIGTRGSVWSDEGQLVAEGSSQLFCRRRPERFK